MQQMNSLFARMDSWRHFPNYQLERRADIFFSLYLAEVLENKLGFAIHPELAPEFPVHIRTIYPDKPTDKSYKIDYLALSSTSDQSVFVELKTESRSVRPEQDKYLLAAQKCGLPRLLNGLLNIFQVTSSKRKYFCLLEHLEGMGLLEIPALFKEIMKRDNLTGSNKASDKIVITAPLSEPIIIYILPNGTGPNIISFQDFAKIVQRHDDPVSNRFAESLNEWSAVDAGKQRTNNPLVL